MNDIFESSSSSSVVKDEEIVPEASSSLTSSSSSSSSLPDNQGRRNLRATGPAPKTTITNSEATDITNSAPRSAPNSAPQQHHRHLDLRTTFEESFDNAQDVEDIFEDIYEEEKHGDLYDAAAAAGSSADDESRQSSSLSSEDQNFTLDEDYYADLPSFVVHRDYSASSSSSDVNGNDNDDESSLQQCKCIDCLQDDTCGGIWKRERFPTTTTNAGPVDLTKVKVHIVISHCMSDLDWIPEFTKSYPVASLHIVTKCGKADKARETAPSYATIQEYENLGRCDHTYAYYITTVLPQRVKPGEEGNSVAIFLKDDISAANFHQSGHWNDFEGLVKAAGSKHGFGCGIVPGGVDFGRDSFDLSTYHETKTLHTFSMDTYNRSKGGRYKIDLGEFLSEYKSLGQWYTAMGAPTPPEAMQVCYGGVFSGSFRNIYKSTDVNKVIAEMDTSMWKNVEVSLSRGNNIQEGHFAERSWAPMIQTQLPTWQLEALLEKADGVYMNKSSFHGTLMMRPKLYLHVGSEGTTSTEVLRESMVSHIDLLKLDGYKIAVHGKYDNGEHGFPNMDNLGACMWSDIIKAHLPARMKEATVCDEHLLPNLSEYMEETFKESHDLIMLNPTLTRQGSAEPLSIYLDYVWDVKVAIYYRRFFEWISFKYNTWREEQMANSLSASGIPTTYRYIDFLREHCKQLFYGKDVNEDGFPVRKLRRDARKEATEKRKKTVVSTFNPTTNFDLEELTGLEDYVYFVAKQYYSEARFRRGIKIVNYHDTHSIETDFYCHVLHDAPNSCNDAVQREIQMQDYSYGQEESTNSETTLSPSVALEDIVIEAYFSGRLSFDLSQPQKKFASQISLWKEMIAIALRESNVSVEHLPTECLYKYERARLLEASLAYEKSMLPDFFASPKGAPKLKSDFEKWRFCSVDSAAIISDPRWDFLFKDASDFSVPKQRKAFLHIGAPQMDGALIETALARDESILKDDQYFFFVSHDNLAPCVWSDDQRRKVAAEGGHDGANTTCPEYLLPHFHEFLSNATAADSDVVISDEWLSMPSSEMGLLKVLENFDPLIVLYYRRFVDWILISYYQSHLDAGVSTLESMNGQVRLVDFIRHVCSRLFASETNHPGKRLIDLPLTPDYTYQLWERYMDVPANEGNIEIVNFDDRPVVQSLLCDVLDAEKACKFELDRFEMNKSAKSPSESSVPKYVEMAMGLQWNNGVRSMKSFYKLADIYEEKMTARGLVEDDIPEECLSRAEMSMLHMVSLEYERILLPSHRDSSQGEENMRQHFAALVASGAFCSVDLDKMVHSMKWQFLFEPLDETLAL